MKKIILSLIVFAFIANVSAQLKVDASGNVGIGKNPQYKLDVAGDIYIGSASNVIGTTNTNPITFKVNNVLAGFTGAENNTNVSFGYNSIPNPSPDKSNTAIGYYALHNNTNGNLNIANGYLALYSNISGSNNTANGNWALYYNTSGNNNTAIGYSAGVNGANYSNTTAIGYNAKATASNQIVLGNYTVTSVGSTVVWSTTSDGRTKKNIQTDVPGLAFINRLQPITYNLDLAVLDELQKSNDPKINAHRDSIRRTLSPEEKEIEAKARANKEKQVYSGFIAQDVEKAAKSLGYDFSGVDAPENGKGTYGLRYAEFVVPLVKAVQELSEQNDQLREQNNRIQEQVNELTGLINKLLGKEDASIFRSENSGNSATGLTELTNYGASLEQNIPNPFDQTTVIRYTLPQACNSAQIVITNTSGGVVRQIPLYSGTNSITIEGGSLQAGIYLYTLVADGNVVDTKRMILTK